MTPVIPSRPPPVAPSPVTPPVESPNFPIFLRRLRELGFAEEECRQALGLAEGDLDRAVEILLSGGVMPSAGGGGGSPAPPPKYHDMQGVFDSLTPGEKAAVERLTQGGQDPGFILDVFVACGKDESRTRSLLS
jgi:hypothetical protein